MNDPAAESSDWGQDFDEWLPLARNVGHALLRRKRIPLSVCGHDDIEQMAAIALHQALQVHEPGRQELVKFLRIKIWMLLWDQLRGLKIVGRRHQAHAIFLCIDDIPSVQKRRSPPNQEKHTLWREVERAIDELQKRRQFAIRSTLAGETRLRIGVSLGVNQARASQIYSRAVEDLRERLAA